MVLPAALNTPPLKDNVEVWLAPVDVLMRAPKVNVPPPSLTVLEDVEALTLSRSNVFAPLAAVIVNLLRSRAGHTERQTIFFH